MINDHPIISFLKEHPHCLTLCCTRCGGRSLLHMDIQTWIDTSHYDLSALLMTITPLNMANFRGWQDYIPEFIQFIDEPSKKEKIIRTWGKQFPDNKFFAKLILQNLSPGLFSRGLDDDWFFTYFELNERDMVYGDLLRIKSYLGPNEHLLGIKSYLRPNEHLLPIITEKNHSIDVEKAEQRIIEERRGAKRNANNIAEKLAFAKYINKFRNLEPLERLETVLNEVDKPLGMFPPKWAELPDELFSGLSSNELTDIITLITGRIKRRGKSVWRELGGQLCLLRQSKRKEERDNSGS
jgi:hypothetical protein